MELFLTGNEPKVLSNKRPRALYVVGPDMDLSLVKSLVPKDQVLMEINGARYWSALKHPLVAEAPWEVVENTVGEKDSHTIGQIVLRHPKVAQPLVLDYEYLVEIENTPDKKTFHPAVWSIVNPSLAEGVLYVVLQMVAFRIPEDRLEQFFPARFDINSFMEALEDDRVKVGVLEDWVKAFSRIDEQGWHLCSVKRIALRSQVRTSVVNALRTGDFNALLQVTDEDLLKMRRECHWLRYLTRQNSLISHDTNRTFQKTDV